MYEAETVEADTDEAETDETKTGETKNDRRRDHVDYPNSGPDRETPSSGLPTTAQRLAETAT
jgi:hypothetical protein